MTTATFSRITAAAILGISLVALTGCGPINAGSAGAEKFEEYVSTLADVQDVSSSGSNDLPFAGTVRGTVTVAPTLNDERMRDVVDALGEYIHDHNSLSFDVQVDRGDDSLYVAPTRTLNDAVFSVYDDVRALDSFVETRLLRYEGWLVVSTHDAVVPAFDVLFASASSTGMQWRSTAYSVDEAVVINGRDERPDGAIEVYEAVGAQFEVVEATLSESGAVVRVASEADVPAARELAEKLWSGAPTDLIINGGIVTRDGEGDFSVVDPIIESILELPGMTAIEAAPDGLLITVDAFEALAALEATIAAQPQTASLRYVSYRSAAGVLPGFALYGSGTERGAFVPAVTALLATDYLVDVTAREGDSSLLIEVGEYDRDRMAAFAAELKAVVPIGTAIQLEAADAGAGFGIRFTVSDRLDSTAIDSFRGTSPEAFVAAWNAAPATP